MFLVSGKDGVTFPHKSKELVTLIFQMWKCLDFLFGKLPNFSLDQRLVDGRCENIDIPIHLYIWRPGTGLNFVMHGC